MAGEKKRIPKSGEVYEHFKGNLYFVIGYAHDTESEKLMVIYKHYDQRFSHHAFLWVRPLDIWNSPAIVDGHEVERFKLREDLMNEKAFGSRRHAE